MTVTTSIDLQVIAGEFTANTQTAGNEVLPKTFGLTNGGFVTAYVSDGQTLLDFYDASGAVQGTFRTPFEGPTNNTGNVSVTQLVNGNVLAVWDDDEATDPGLRAHVFSASGDPIGGETPLTAIDASFSLPSIAATTDGGFRISYSQNGGVFTASLTSTFGITSFPTPVNTAATTGDQTDSSIAVLADGGYVVTYTDTNPADQTIRATIYNADNTVRTADFVLASTGDNSQSSTVALQNGGFATVYTDSGWAEGGALGNGISLQLSNASGGFVGFAHVNTTSSVDEVDPDVTQLANGYLLVTWTRPFESDVTDTDIRACVFTEAGVPVAINGSTDEFSIAASSVAEAHSSVAHLLGGDFTVAYEQVDANELDTEIRQQVLGLIRTSIGDGANDTIAGDALRDSIDGGAGNDQLTGGDGRDTVHGGADADTIEGGRGADTLFGDGGDDFIFANVQGNAQSSIDSDMIDGGAGNDSLVGSGGQDTIHGGDDADTIEGGFSADQLFGDGGDDRIYAHIQADPTNSAAGDMLDGGEGADTLVGSGGADTLIGGLGADSMDGGAGADTMTGGIGNDTYVVDDSGDRVSEGVNAGYDTVSTTLASYTLGANLERLNFTDTGAHTGRGNELSNRINGNAGLDKFIIDAGGNDIFSGGSGEDSFDARSSATGMILRLDNQASNAGSVAGDTFASVEKFFGSNTAADQMTTGAARAKFFGFGGNDTLTGGASIDALSGGAGNDSLAGNGGQDALDGGTGNDTMTGGAARDLFTVVDAAFGKDVITDFQDGVDKLRFFSAVADSLNDFIINGDGTTEVTLTLAANEANTITLRGASPILITQNDFLFY